MENKDNYVGTGWANEYGISISINVEKIKALTPDSYGNVRLYVGKRKEIDAKSKASHWVKESKPFEKKNENPFDN